MTTDSFVFTLCPHLYSNNECKVLYVISYLRRMIMSWAHNIAENFNHLYHRNYYMFKTTLNNLYLDHNLQVKNENKLSHLTQTKSAVTYGIEFQSLVEPLDLNNNSKCLLFFQKSSVKDIIADIRKVATFKLLMNQAISINERKYQRELESKESSSSKKPKPESLTTIDHY